MTCLGTLGAPREGWEKTSGRGFPQGRRWAGQVWWGTDKLIKLHKFLLRGTVGLAHPGVQAKSGS